MSWLHWVVLPCCPLSDLGQRAGKSHFGDQAHREQGTVN